MMDAVYVSLNGDVLDAACSLSALVICLLSLTCLNVRHSNLNKKGALSLCRDTRGCAGLGVHSPVILQVLIALFSLGSLLHFDTAG